MKKEKRKILPSRRKRTVRRILIAAVVLFLVNRIFLIGLLFPIQAIRQNEEREGTGRTAVVCRNWAPEMHKSHLIYLMENEKATMLSGAYLTPLGWMNAFGITLDCAEPAPIHGGWWSMVRGEGPSLFYVFGRVDSPDIDLLQITVQAPEGAPKEDDARRYAYFAWGLEREDLIEKDGRFYFLLEKYPVDWSEYPNGFCVTALGCDKEGNVIAQMELEQGMSSNFG